MPWCPSCKTEYKEGVTICVDCGSELISEQPVDYDYVTLTVIEKQEVADKLIKYLEYSHINCYYEYSEEEIGFVIMVRDEEIKKAQKSFQAFYNVEAELLSSSNVVASQLSSKKIDGLAFENLQEEEVENEEVLEVEDDEMLDPEDVFNSEEPEEELEQDIRKVSKMMYDGGAYEKKSDKSKEMKSTAVTFFVFGILGLLFIALNLVNVLDIVNGPIPYLVMSAMFIGFLLIGNNSVERAKKAAKESVLEEETTEQIIAWLDNLVTPEALLSMKDSSLSEEANFIRVMENIKFIVTKQFGELDDAYLDYVTEEFYNNKFEA
jgi:hypothetical protein